MPSALLTFDPNVLKDATLYLNKKIYNLVFDEIPMNPERRVWLEKDIKLCEWILNNIENHVTDSLNQRDIIKFAETWRALPKNVQKKFRRFKKP